MGWSRPDEDSRADHYRDERKHDWRPGDEPPLSVQVDLSDVMNVVASVKLINNYQAAADLIDAYADAKAEAVRIDAVSAGAHP